nr:dehydration-responsive element-binding protein 2A-like [Tanacetum cinerariifolium]
MSQLSETTCVPKDNWKKRTASESMDEKLTKRQKRNRAEAPKIMAETLAKWTEYNKDEKAIKRKTPAKGSKKGCIKGKGGPENSKCSFRGVRQRT